MKLKFLAVFISFACFNSTNIQANQLEGSFEAPLVKDSLLLDATTSEANIVVGERGHILLAAKNALDFEQKQSPVKTTLTAVTSRNSTVWAVGHDATILKSSDAGQTWKLIQQKPDLDRPLLDVHFFDENEGIAVGAYGLFYRSTDGGESWIQESHASVLSQDDISYLDSIKDDEDFYLEELSFISPHFNRLSEANGNLYVAGEAGLVALSNDRGHTWKRLDIDYYGSFFDVQEIQNGLTLAVGLRGNIFLLQEDNWQRIESCVTTTLNSIEVLGEKLYVAGNNGVLLSIQPSTLSSSEKGEPNTEGCRAQVSVNKVETDLSDAILTLLFVDETVTAVTAGGLKSVNVEL